MSNETAALISAGVSALAMQFLEKNPDLVTQFGEFAARQQFPFPVNESTIHLMSMLVRDHAQQAIEHDDDDDPQSATIIRQAAAVPVPQIEDGVAASANALMAGAFAVEFARQPGRLAEFYAWLVQMHEERCKNDSHEQHFEEDYTPGYLKQADEMLTMMATVMTQMAKDGNVSLSDLMKGTSHAPSTDSHLN